MKENKTHKINLVSLLAVIIIVSVLIFSTCAPSNDNSVLQIHYDYPVSLSAKSMADTADYVVIGK